MNDTAAVITVSDKGYLGQREDTSGPAIAAALEEAGYTVVYRTIVPDEESRIEAELLRCADEKGIALILTTGGTGFSPRDVTPEAALRVIRRETRGIPELMRAESMKITDRGCLSRAVAGIRGRSLLITLPGSKKAALENLQAVLRPIRHGLDMLMSQGSADCGEEGAKKPVPSMDAWLREAKAQPDAGGIGMFLTHNGIVRATAREEAREGIPKAPVVGMLFSYDPKKVDAAIAETLRLPGIRYARAWLNEGRLRVGDDIMYVLVGGDIRPHVVDALQFLVGKLKAECVTETELV